LNLLTGRAAVKPVEGPDFKPSISFEPDLAPLERAGPAHSASLKPHETHTARASSEAQQEKHYDAISAEYETHYSDDSSREYRRRFIYEPMFSEIELSGMNVLDAMCGSGQTTEFLLAHGASVTGIDISKEVIEAFQTRWPEAQAVRRSLLDSNLPESSFDCVTVVGGLHHIHPHVSEALVEIHRLLKPGGFFCFMEPHSGSLPDVIRKFWYKYDRFFSDNEAAIDLSALEQEFSSRFSSRTVRYQGNVAFLLVLNSLIFRIPVSLKPYYSSPLMSVEEIVSRMQGKRMSCFVVGQWRKRVSTSSR
jgi:ubiquinone/menaquinone biosynthesis C-methylase UbiE